MNDRTTVGGALASELAQCRPRPRPSLRDLYEKPFSGHVLPAAFRALQLGLSLSGAGGLLSAAILSVALGRSEPTDAFRFVLFVAVAWFAFLPISFLWRFWGTRSWFPVITGGLVGALSLAISSVFAPGLGLLAVAPHVAFAVAPVPLVTAAGLLTFAWEPIPLRRKHAVMMRRRESLVAEARGWAASGRTQSLRSAVLMDGDLTGVDLGGADGNEGADLRDANLIGADLQGADLSYASIAGASLHGANLREARLSHLRGSEMREQIRKDPLGPATKGEADPSPEAAVTVHVGVSMPAADLTDADLRVADLKKANLEGVTLRGADLRGAEMGGAALRHADLRGTDLEGAALAGADLAGARYDAGTRWPAGWTHPLRYRSSIACDSDIEPTLKESG